MRYMIFAVLLLGCSDHSGVFDGSDSDVMDTGTGYDAFKYTGYGVDESIDSGGELATEIDSGEVPTDVDTGLSSGGDTEWPDDTDFDTGMGTDTFDDSGTGTGDDTGVEVLDTDTAVEADTDTGTEAGSQCADMDESGVFYVGDRVYWEKQDRFYLCIDRQCIGGFLYGGWYPIPSCDAPVDFDLDTGSDIPVDTDTDTGLDTDTVVVDTEPICMSGGLEIPEGSGHCWYWNPDEYEYKSCDHVCDDLGLEYDLFTGDFIYEDEDNCAVLGYAFGFDTGVSRVTVQAYGWNADGCAGDIRDGMFDFLEITYVGQFITSGATSDFTRFCACKAPE